MSEKARKTKFSSKSPWTEWIAPGSYMVADLSGTMKTQPDWTSSGEAQPDALTEKGTGTQKDTGAETEGITILPAEETTV